MTSSILFVGCSPGHLHDNESVPVSTPASTSPSNYVLPAAVGSFTNVWAADPGVDLFAEPVAVVRAAVEAKAVADMVGRANSYPGYDRFLSAGTETVQGKGDIHVEDAPSFEEPIALAGTKHYRLYDVTLSDTAVDARVCEIAFGTYQPDAKHARKPYEPVDLRPVTDPGLLDEGRIPAVIETWRLRLDRDSMFQQLPQASQPTTPTPSDRSPSPPARYPNQDLFLGWNLKQFSYETGLEPPCNGWARKFYPMAIIGTKGIAYPTNPVDAAYLPTLPPYPGWTHDPAV
ncbi:hypothetical protein [Kitasatospora arboriphila]|uniref:hypothetical protein n=1 Tax=Kitasatospora arboriphila TaxID=258052 RepID=UPI0018DD4AF5|nr:hypothetical protein [Kitasatospora arboriphila]